MLHEKIEDTELYEQVKQISENFLREELKEKEKEIAFTLDENTSQKKEIQRLEGLNTQVEGRLKEQNEKMYNIARKSTLKRFVLIWWGIPISLSIAILVFVFFVSAQFFWVNAKWNFIAELIAWVNNTPFGKSSGGAAIYIVDCVFFAIIAYMVKKWMRNPFNKSKRDEYRRELIHKYLENI